MATAVSQICIANAPRRAVLNIGKLGAGGERYYLGTVASGAEDYYTGAGEAAGY